MSVQIDKKLNLVIPISKPSGEIYVHSTPIDLKTFKKFYLPISKAFSAIYSEGLNVIAGPRVAAMILEDVSRRSGLWEGPEGVEAVLLTEIRRLTNVVAPSDHGWASTPLEIALSRKLLDEEEWSEVENALAFFTVVSAMHKRSELETVLGGAVRLWGAQLSSLNCTEYAGSLETSTETGISSPRKRTSSVVA